MFPRDMVCLRNISVDTLHIGDTEDDDDDDNDDNNNNKTKYRLCNYSKLFAFSITIRLTDNNVSLRQKWKYDFKVIVSIV
jgi:hypothetical protein